MRAFNRVLSAFLAAILVVVGVLTILEICRAALSQPPAVVQWPKLLPKLKSNSYDDAGPILVCVGLGILGSLILASGLRRGKPYALPAGSTAPGVRTEINRRSLHRAMHSTVLATDRVESGSVALHRRSATIVAQANTPRIEGLDAEIRRRIEALLASIALVDPPRLKIKVRTRAAAAATTPTPPPVPTSPAPQQVRPPTTPDPDPVVPGRAVAASEPKEPASRALPETAPLPQPKPKSDAPESPTARLEDLLSYDPEDESR